MSAWQDLLREGAGYQYKAIAYGPGESPPAEFWRKIELTYPDGRMLTLVYDVDPGVTEMQALMFKLQIVNRGHFDVHMIEPDD
jgi:hypothetical protein